MSFTPRLVIDGLTARYGISPVLRGVQLKVGRGEVVGLIGPNGAGKTTTLRAISGLVHREASTLTLDGVAIPSSPDRATAAGIAHVPEGRGMMPTLTVLQNIKVGSLAAGRTLTPAMRSRIFALFPRLDDLQNRRAGSLSGGEQQMVAIARGLAAAPRVLMIDELSLGLAPKIVSDLLRALVTEAREQEVALLIVDQNVRALNSVCDRMYSLKHGRTQPVSGQQDEFSDVYFSIR